MPFPKGFKPKTTGETKLIRSYIDAHPFMMTVTSTDILNILKDAGIKLRYRKMASNILSNLMRTGDIKYTGEKDNRVKIYTILRKDAGIEEPSQEPVTYQKTEERITTGADIVEDKASVNNLEKTIKELEDQLLTEMQKNEEFETKVLNLHEEFEAKTKALNEALEAKTEELRAKTKEFKAGIECDELRLGRSVFRAYNEVTQELNQLEAKYRDEISKLNRLRTEDREMIGATQRKVKELEEENRKLRSNISQGISANRKVDIGIFNRPRIKGGTTS